MLRLILNLIFLLLSFLSIGQEAGSIQAQLYRDAIEEADSEENLQETCKNLTALEKLGPVYYWESLYLRVEIYLTIDDSMVIADKLLDQCIAHSYKTGDLNERLDLYKSKQYTAGILLQFQAAVDTINQAIRFAEEIKDSSESIFFHELLGFYYLELLSDPITASTHLKKSLSLALNTEDWPQAVTTLKTMVQAAQLKGDSVQARKNAELAVLYAQKLASTDVLHYSGYPIRGNYYLSIHAYSQATKDGLIAFEKANYFEDESLLLLASYLLTEIYWKRSHLDSAYYYAQIVNEIMGSSDNYYDFRQFYSFASQIYAAQGLRKKALLYLKKYNDYQQIHFDKNQVSSAAKAMLISGVKRKELEKTKVKLELELTQSQSTFKSYLLGFILLLLLAGIGGTVALYRKKQYKKQLNQALLSSNEVINSQKDILRSDLEQLKKTIVPQKDTKELDSYYSSQSGVKIRFKDILYLESSNNYVLIHNVDQNAPLLERIPMSQLVETFPSAIFVRIHRSYAVNLSHIIARPSKYIVTMRNEVVLKVSRTYVGNIGPLFLKK